jgi:hypothetical protein
VVIAMSDPAPKDNVSPFKVYENEHELSQRDIAVLLGAIEWFRRHLDHFEKMVALQRVVTHDDDVGAK